MTELRDYHFKAWAKFRFLALDEIESECILKEVTGSRSKKHFKEPCFVGVVPLEDTSVIAEIARFYEKYNVEKSNCDIVLSISTEKDTEMWSVPKIVNEMLRVIDCKLTVSFTCT